MLKHLTVRQDNTTLPKQFVHTVSANLQRTMQNGNKFKGLLDLVFGNEHPNVMRSRVAIAFQHYLLGTVDATPLLSCSIRDNEIVLSSCRFLGGR